MAIVLNHTIVPAHDKQKAAQLFARLFALSYGGAHGHFAPVKVNDELTLLFDDSDEFDSHHLAFHVSEPEFSGIFGRIKSEGLVYGSAPWSADDGQINDRDGGRGVYFTTPDGHLFELMTGAQ